MDAGRKNCGKSFREGVRGRAFSEEKALPREYFAWLLFFVSGAAALVLETLWVRLFALSFGTTGLAMATVLTAFMAGLALGGALGGRLADRLATPRRLFTTYAVMEAAIAAYAASMPIFRGLAASIDGALEGVLAGSLIGLSLGRFAAAFVVLLIPTTLMGATLPVLTAAVAGGDGRVSRAAGSLYAVNMFGAVVGAASTPFVLLPAFGVRGTGYVVALADLGVALAAFAISRFSTARKNTGEKSWEEGSRGRDLSSERSLPQEHHHPGRRTAALAVAGIAASGAVAMVYQQVWARLLSLVIGSSVHAVAVILALFLLGLAAGSAVYSRRTVLVPGQALNLAVVHCAVALWGVATIRLADQLPAAFVVGLSLTGISVPSVVAVQVAVAGALVVPPTFFMGMTFPATLRLVEQGRGDLGTGRAVGWTYWGNTVGAIAGSFVGGFVVLPALGAQGAMVACTLASLVLAAGYSGLGARITGPRRAAGHAIATVLISVALPAAYHPWNLAALSSGVFRVSRSGELAQALGHLGTGPEPASEAVSPRLTPWIARARSLVQPRDIWDEGLGPVDAPRMLFHEAGVAATVAVTETAARSILEGHDWVTYSLRVNGKADASLTVLSGVPPDDPAAISPQGDAETQTLSGVLAFLLHPGRPRSALVIGWGSGLTAGSALATGLGSVRAVEIERRVVEGSTPFQPYAGSPLLDPRLELIEDDGRRLLAAREDRYDIIVSEPSNPWISGCSNLFTVEFFQLVASRLNRGGRFLQWVQAYEISPRTMASILASVSAVFRSVVVFQPTHSPSDLLIVAGQDEVRLDFEAMASRITTPRVASRLEPFGIFGPEDVAARLVLGEHEVARVIRGAGLNTDDNLVVELAAPFDLVRFRDASGPRLLSSLGVIPARLPDDLAGREGVVGEGLEPALARAGRSRRDAPYLPPPDAATELLALDAARTGSPRPPGASPPSTEQLAADLDPDREEALGLALLGLAAANEGQSRLAMLLLLAHLRSAAPPVRAAREVLAAWSWESGIYPRAWMLRHGPVIPSPPDPPRTSGRPASLFQNPF